MRSSFPRSKEHFFDGRSRGRYRPRTPVEIVESACRFESGLEKLLDGRRRLCALTLPVRDASGVERETRRDARIESADLLDEATVARVALIGDDDAVERTLFGTVTSETNVNSHVAFELVAFELKELLGENFAFANRFSKRIFGSSR